MTYDILSYFVSGSFVFIPMFIHIWNIQQLNTCEYVYVYMMRRGQAKAQFYDWNGSLLITSHSYWQRVWPAPLPGMSIKDFGGLFLSAEKKWVKVATYANKKSLSWTTILLCKEPDHSWLSISKKRYSLDHKKCFGTHAADATQRRICIWLILPVVVILNAFAIKYFRSQQHLLRRHLGDQSLLYWTEVNSWRIRAK